MHGVKLDVASQTIACNNSQRIIMVDKDYCVIVRVLGTAVY